MQFLILSMHRAAGNRGEGIKIKTNYKQFATNKCWEKEENIEFVTIMAFISTQERSVNSSSP